jgi:hypothetical protein
MQQRGCLTYNVNNFALNKIYIYNLFIYLFIHVFIYHIIFYCRTYKNILKKNFKLKCGLEAQTVGRNPPPFTDSPRSQELTFGTTYIRL